MKTIIKFIFTGIIGLLSNVTFAQPATDSGTIGDYPAIYPDAKPMWSYQDLINVQLPNTIILSAEKIEGEDICLVTTIVNHPPANDKIKIWIALPLNNWNGRFYGRGGGGFRGGNPAELTEPARKGFVAAATDTGHDGDSGSFALDTVPPDWQQIRNFAYLGIHDMTVTGKALVEAFYGKPAAYSYFVGESTGGRQGMMEAQRYPEDYNGILSGCPAINWPSFIPSELWPQIVMYQDNNYVSDAKLEAVTKAVIEACDAEDGTRDGVIADPIRCNWDPTEFVGTTVGDETFTKADADVVRKIWDGPRSASGKRLWYGLTRGANLNALAGTKGNPLMGVPFSVSLDWFRYFLSLNPDLQIYDIDYTNYELLFNQSAEAFSSVLATDNPDLSRFRDNGGKILILHGLSDHLITPYGIIEYYTLMQQYMGGQGKNNRFCPLVSASWLRSQL